MLLSLQRAEATQPELLAHLGDGHARVAPGRVDRRAVVARGRGRVVEDGLLDARARARADRGRELEAAAREAARDDDARVDEYHAKYVAALKALHAKHVKARVLQVV